MKNDTIDFNDTEICDEEGISFRKTKSKQNYEITSEVFPVPTNDLATLKYVLPNKQNATFTVLNIYGQSLKSYQLSYGKSEFQFSTDLFPNGIYFYIIITNSTESVSKGKFSVNK